MAKFDDFIYRQLGKAVDFDGAAGVQCVDLIKAYISEVFDIKPKAIGNAHAYYDDYSKHKFLKDNFKRIPNSPDFVPQRGDICVWRKSLNGYGHVSIASGDGTTRRFSSYDQNWGGKAVKIVKHTYTHFAGVLRPKSQLPITGEAAKKEIYFRRYYGKSGSVVDALVSLGEKSSFLYRRKIAIANGISGYVGTPAQNVKLLKLLKRGKLLRP